MVSQRGLSCANAVGERGTALSPAFLERAMVDKSVAPVGQSDSSFSLHPCSTSILPRLKEFRKIQSCFVLEKWINVSDIDRQGSA